MRNSAVYICLFALLVGFGMVDYASAQTTSPDQCSYWRTNTEVVWVEQEVTENQVITETSYQTREVTKSRPSYVSKQRQRTVTQRKPVTETSERLVTKRVLKPVTTTKTRTERRVEETWDNVTEMRDETYTVQKPVVETVMEEQTVRVRKPVTQRRIETENVTVYRPQETTRTELVPGTLVVPGQQPWSSRPRARWLQRGYYTDPYTGQQVWRRAGLHWVNEPAIGQNAIPVTVPQQRTSTTLVPETVTREKPVEVTSYVDQFETRKVPVEVERMVTETRTRKVPVTYQVPNRKVVEYDVPYTETTYVEETVTERVPVEKTVMETVTRTEPYNVVEASWEDYTETIKIPTQTTRKVPVVAMYRVPYLVDVRVPYNAAGQAVGRGHEVPGSHRLHPKWRSMLKKVSDTSTRVESSTIADPPSARSIESNIGASGRSVLDKADPLGPAPKGLEFGSDAATTETSLAITPIKRRSTTLANEPRETEESRKAREEINARFDAIGMKPSALDDPPQEENVSTQETAASQPESASNEEPSRIDINKEKLSIDVEMPPNAGSAASDSDAVDAGDADDGTIGERDVDVSRSR